MKRFFVAMMIIVSAIACDEKDEERVQEPGMIRKEARQRPAGMTKDVVAVVGVEEITVEDFDKYVGTLPQGQKEWANSPQGKKYILDTLITSRLIEQEFNKRGLDKNPEYLSRIENYRKQLMIEFVQNDLIKEEIKVTNEDVEKYYREHEKEFNIPEQVKILDMVVADEKEAMEVISRLKKGEDFATLAANLSIDSFTKSRSGDLPPFTRDARPDIAEKAFSAKRPNEIIGPVKTSQGYHIIKFIKRIPPQSRSFAEVKESLKARLIAMRRNEIYQNFLKQVRENTNIKLNEEFVEGRRQENKKTEKK